MGGCYFCTWEIFCKRLYLCTSKQFCTVTVLHERHKTIGHFCMAYLIHGSSFLHVDTFSQVENFKYIFILLTLINFFCLTYYPLPSPLVKYFL